MLTHRKSILQLCIVVIVCCFTFPLLANSSLKIGIVLWRGETGFDRGFIQEIKRLMPYTVVDIQDSDQNLRQTITTLESKWGPRLSEFDYIVTFGSRNSLKSYKILKNLNYRGTHAGFGNSQRLIDIFNKRNMTKDKFLLARSSINSLFFLDFLLPLLKSKHIGVPYNKLEPQVKETLSALQNIAHQHNARIRPIPLMPDKTTLDKQAHNIFNRSERMDMIYLPLDSLILSQSKQIVSIAEEHNILSVGEHKKYFQDGATIAAEANFKDIGRALAHQIYAIENGQSIYSSKIIENENPLLHVHSERLKKHAPHLLGHLPSKLQFSN